MNFGAVDDVNDDPGFFTGIFTVQDPVQNRRIMGIGRVNLVGKSVEFNPIGPAEGVGFAMTPDRKRGYGLLQQIGRYEFWAFDLEQKKLLNRTQFSGRPRNGAAGLVEREAPVCVPGGRDDRCLRGRDLQVPSHDRNDGGPDDQPLRPAEERGPDGDAIGADAYRVRGKAWRFAPGNGGSLRSPAASALRVEGGPDKNERSQM